jgi:hypothetical protein
VHVGFTDDMAASIKQRFDDQRVRGRGRSVCQRRATGARRKASNVDAILDAHAQAILAESGVLDKYATIDGTHRRAVVGANRHAGRGDRISAAAFTAASGAARIVIPLLRQTMLCNLCEKSTIMVADTHFRGDLDRTAGSSPKKLDFSINTITIGKASI